MPLTVQNVYGLLIRSRLLPKETLQALLARWQAEAKGAAGDPAAFLRWLVAEKCLTGFQAARIARGRADHFFFGEYKLLDRLGRGWQTGLYKAAHRLGQVVALKVLAPARVKDPAALARFRRDAHSALRHRHPNVVRAFQLGEAAGAHYLALEHLDAEPLADVLKRRGRLPPGEAVRLVYQALLGLQHLHEQGAAHHALQPANLLVTPPGTEGRPDSTLQATVKLLDAGLARLLREDAAGEASPLGSPAYLAPEQARDPAAADIRADVYSLGCVLYHALAGRPPFPDPDPARQALRHAQEAPPPLRELNPEVPDGLQQIVDWMTAKDPARRYPTPERAAQALAVFLAAGAEQPTKAAAPEMASFLNWLDSEGGGPPQPAEPPAAPAEQPLKPLPATPDEGKPSRPAKSSHKRHAKKPKPAPDMAPPPPPADPKAAEPAPVWDVELVPALPLQQTVLSVKGLVLTRRDLLMGGLGAGLVAAAGLISLALSQVGAPRKKNGEPTPPAEGEGGQGPK